MSKKLTGRFLSNGLTPKQDKFARLYVELGNASEAYRQSYSASGMSEETIWVKASQLLAQGKVKVRVAEASRTAAERHDVTVDSIMKELETARETALRGENAASMVAASMGKAKLAGLIVDKQKIDGSSFEQRFLKMIKDLDAKVQARQEQPEPTPNQSADDQDAAPHIH